MDDFSIIGDFQFVLYFPMVFSGFHMNASISCGGFPALISGHRVGLIWAMGLRKISWFTSFLYAYIYIYFTLYIISKKKYSYAIVDCSGFVPNHLNFSTLDLPKLVLHLRESHHSSRNLEVTYGLPKLRLQSVPSGLMTWEDDPPNSIAAQIDSFFLWLDVGMDQN